MKPHGVEFISSNKFSCQRFESKTMNNILWLIFAVIIGIFNAIAIAATLLVIAPTISQAAVIAWICGGFIAGFFIAQRKA